jgi:hypothetical protein
VALVADSASVHEAPRGIATGGGPNNGLLSLQSVDDGFPDSHLEP